MQRAPQSHALQLEQGVRTLRALQLEQGAGHCELAVNALKRS